MRLNVTLQLLMKNQPKQFVLIQGNKYTFYLGTSKVISLVSDNMDARWLEEYRKNHRRIFQDLEPDPTTA